MKHLFMVRHRRYNQRGNLTSIGKRYISGLAGQMKKISGELNNGFCLLSSTAPRAEQTAEIIADAFGLESFIRNDKLFSEGEEELSAQQLRIINEVISSHIPGNDAIAVASHWDIVYSYSRYIWREQFEGNVEDIQEPEKGEAVHFDLRKRIYKMLPK